MKFLKHNFNSNCNKVSNFGFVFLLEDYIKTQEVNISNSN